MASPERAGQAVREDTGLIIVETPANPTLAEVDIQAVAAASAGVPVLVDNTFATPVLQRPRDHGASIVLHSATKFLGGHGDVMGGVVACDEDYARLLRQIRFATGGVVHPLAAYLLHRGLQTLPVRVERASSTAAALAGRLRQHPRVTAVHYPALSSGRPAGQLTDGGPLLSIQVDSRPQDVIAAVRLITPAVSLGSTDTLIQHPASLSHHILDPADRYAGGISDSLLRLSIGLEGPDDLWDDLNQALRAARSDRMSARGITAGANWSTIPALPWTFARAARQRNVGRAEETPAEDTGSND